MTSLEFIEKQIDIYKNVKQRAILQIPDEDDDEKLYKLQDKIDICNERISYFQQIKSELEAWEICKKHHHINKYDGKRFDITIWLNSENCGFEYCASYEECLKVKKVLEVKHE